MAGNSVEPTDRDAPADQARTPDAPHVDALTHLLALLPSADHLRTLAAGGASPASTHHEAGAGDLAASLGVSRALLNPLASLPRPLSLDDVKRRVHAAPAPHTTPAY